jgi:predicted transcriptional regulator
MGLLDSNDDNYDTNHCADYRSPEFFQAYAPYFPALPEFEQVLLGYVSKGIKQGEIASLLKITQGAVSSRISRIRKRLKFLKELEGFKCKDSIDQDLSSLFSPFEIELLKTMMKTTCQSETARRLNIAFNLQGPKASMTQVKVRHYYEKCLLKLKEALKTEPKYREYYHLFYYVRHHLYLMHEVKLPHFAR